MRRLQLMHDGWRLRALRRAYTSESGYRSATPDYAGMLDELRWGLAHLDARTRERADAAALRASFYGELPLRGLGWLGRRHADLQARLLAAASPRTLQFLVGEIVHDDHDDHVNRIPSCRFRREGGTIMCREICQQPTEAFTRAHALPLVLEPLPDSDACRWTWGKTRDQT